MDREIAITGWPARWVDRTLPQLYYYTIALTYVQSAWMLALGARTLFLQYKCRRSLDDDPSNRAAIMASFDKRTIRASRTVFWLTLVYIFHAMAIWLVDACIGFKFLSADASETPYVWDSVLILYVAATLSRMVLGFVAAFVVFPLFQMTFVTWAVTRLIPNRFERASVLGEFLPEARILTTHMTQLWSMVAFFIVAWWPVEQRAMLRVFLAEVAFGSCFAWLDASWAFNYCAHRLESVELASSPGVTEFVRVFGTQAMAVHARQLSSKQTLPKYEDVAHDEKAGLENSPC